MTYLNKKDYPCQFYRLYPAWEKGLINTSLPGDSGYVNNMSETTQQNSKAATSINYLHHPDAIPAENLREELCSIFPPKILLIGNTLCS